MTHQDCQVMFFLVHAEQEMVDSQTALKMVDSQTALKMVDSQTALKMVDSQTALKMVVILILHQKWSTKFLHLIHLTMRKFHSCKLQLYSTVCIGEEGGMR